VVKKNIKKYWDFLNSDPRVRKAGQIFRRILVVAIIGIIIYQLFDIGWREVLTSLPTHPLFYILFVVLYLSLPVAEVFIYQQVWKVRKWDSFKAFLTKRVYNEEVMGYSGEFYLFMWARKHLDKGDAEVLKNVRDNNILSSVNSNLVAFSLVGVLIFTGIIELENLVGDVNLVYVAAAIVILAVFIGLFIQFRKYLFALSLKKAAIVFSIYFVRFIIHHGLMIVQWAVVIPGTPLSIWFLFLAIIIVVNRIPFIPSRDLVFMWAGIELSRTLNMATASVAGMLLVSSALRKCTNLILFLVISYYSKDPEIQKLREQSSVLGFSSDNAPNESTDQKKADAQPGGVK
jgi:hypothetical protein